MPIQSEFVLGRLKNVAFFSQKTNLPGVSLQNPSQPTPLVTIPQVGDTVYYDELEVDFLVDEDMKNWEEVFNWIVGIGAPVTKEMYADLQESEDGVFSDATLLIRDSKHNVKHEYRFEDCLPMSLSPINMDTTSSQITYVTARMRLIYKLYQKVPRYALTT